MRYSFSRLLSAALLVLFAGCPLQVFSGDDIPEIRLSGTVISKTEAQAFEAQAFIEYRDGKVSLVKLGDQIDGWGRVTEIQQGKIILRDSDNALYEVLTEGIRSISSLTQTQQQGSSVISTQSVNPVSSNIKSTQSVNSVSSNLKSIQSSTQAVNHIEKPIQQEASYGSATTTAELMSEIYQLTRRNDSVGEDINGKVAQILKLSPDARIVEIDFEPLSKDNASLLKLEQTLDQGSVARLIIQGDPVIKWIYLTPDPNL